MAIYEIFKENHDRKTYSKANIPKEMAPYIHLIEKYGNSTAKQYNKLDMKKIMNEIWNNFNKLEETSEDKLAYIKYELEYLGYIKSDIPPDIMIGQVSNISLKNRSANIKSFKTNNSVWFKIDNDIAIPDRDSIIRILDVKTVNGSNRKSYVIMDYYKLA